MSLPDYYFHDARLLLIPIERLTPGGVSADCADLLVARSGWSPERIDLFNSAFSRYWSRTRALAARTRTWSPPRIRHVGLILDPLSVRPYTQLLNISAWTLYDSDFDPAHSNPEFGAYLLVHGDRMALTGEVATAALHTAAYWFDRSDDECAAFADAAARSPRPDAAAYRILATATSWLRQLSHDTLRPPTILGGYRAIAGTGLLVRRDVEATPATLVQQWTAVAQQTVAAFHAAWRRPDAAAAQRLCDWLAGEAPDLLVCAKGGRVLWDPQTATRLGALRAELRQASGAAVRDIAADLQRVDQHSRAFRRALVEPSALPAPDPRSEQHGYVYMHVERRRIAYNLHEPGIERLQGPALPYARAMLGARTVHEWAHLAVAAGWVPQVAPAEQVQVLTDALAGELATTIAAAPRSVLERTAPDLMALAAPDAGASLLARPGAPRDLAPAAAARLARLLRNRMPDYQANLLARRFLSPVEQETYVRHNVRTLRTAFHPQQLWRMLLRYLYEYQYLAFSAIEDPQTYFLHSTWFDADYIASGILDERRFQALAATVNCLCRTYAVDETRFHAV